LSSRPAPAACCHHRVGYLQRLRSICDQHGILLIFDEVITGFGRLGAAFGANAFGVTPDLITCAKGMTNATVPMGGVIVNGKIYAAMMAGPDKAVELYHGYTYSAHPLACAAALATLDVYQDLDLFGRARNIARVWENAVHALRDCPHVVDIRNIGLLGAIDLRPRDNAPGARGAECANRCYEDGILIRGSGDSNTQHPGSSLDPQLLLVSLHKLMHAVESEVDVRHRTGVHRGSKTLLGMTAVDPAGHQAMIVGRLVVVEHALGCVQDLVLLHADSRELLDHVVEVAG
jgi:adenosylmethionine-8-amino-7-oxononanoate aminotransferase